MAHSGVLVELEGSVAQESSASSVSLEVARALTEQSTFPQPAILNAGISLEVSLAEALMEIFMRLHLFADKVRYVK